MKKIKYLLLVFAVTIVAVSCETYDDFDEDRATVVGLQSAVGGPNVNVPSDGTIDKEINVYVSDVAATERSFAVTVDSEFTEVGSENYIIGNAIVPANQRTGTLIVTFNDVNLTTDLQPVRLKVDNSSSQYVSGGFFTLQVRKVN